MYLSKLELNGFKSFADKTTLNFDEGITAIVGPNGCGKSNIVDAVRWVIGEQRPTALRSQKMENVIFNGTKQRKALGMAEVELTIQNNRGVLPTEYSEVSLGRRLFRSGESEYLMNGTRCRLKDITELFMDTGMGADAYSVIELSMIDEILSDNAQDRRRLFEEAAGITKYKQRRRQSLRKLEQTQADLTRIRDLTDEIGRSVRRLKRQARKAEKYRDLQGTLQRLELHLAQSTFRTLRERQRTTSEKQASLKKQINEQERQEEEQEQRLKTLREDHARHQNVVREREKALQTYRDRARDVQAEVRLQEERIETATKALKRLEQEESGAEAQAEDLQQLRSTLKKQEETTTPALKAAEEQLEEAEAAQAEAEQRVSQHREKLEEARAALQHAAEKRTEHQRQLDRVENRIELKEEDIERANERSVALKDQGESLTERVTKAEQEHREAERAASEVRGNLDDVLKKEEALEAELDAARDSLRRAEREKDAARAEINLLENLLDSFEEFSDAVQFLAHDRSWSDEDIRTVADVLACDEEYRVALETALGDLASCVVASDSDEAYRALAHLRDSNEGQATFITLENLVAPEATQQAPDGATPLREVVRVTAANCSILADVLLHNTFISESLEAAQAHIKAADASARCITPEGEWVNARGVVHGGSRREQPSAVGGRIGRREQLNSAQEQYEKAEEKHAAREKEVRKLKESLAELPVDELERQLHTARNAAQKAAQEFERAKYARSSHADRLGELSDRINELQSELDELSQQKTDLGEKTATLANQESELKARVDSAEETLEEFEEQQREAARHYNDARLEAVEARNEVETLQRDLKRATERLNTLRERAERRSEEIAEHNKVLSASQEALDERTAELEDLRELQPEREARVEAARAEAKKIEKQITDVEATLRSLRKEREELISKSNELAVTRAEIDTRLDDLRERIAADYEQQLEDLPPAPDDFDAEAAAEEIKSIKNKTSRMGSVNPLAVEEYEEKKERLDFLTEQQEDLQKAEDTLLQTITEINQTASDRFEDTFGDIQQSFSQLFVRLFGDGASARLELEDSDDPLDSDINILAQPAGKKPSVLTQLSGGEKALTAIALLFSIYLVKPSPFCILDEVDAPLDDTNVQRFMNLIRDFVDDTQFILVTHDKHTMSMSDRMYGITMQEQGISTLVSVEFEEALALADA